MRVASAVAVCVLLVACPIGAAAQPTSDTTPPSFSDFEVSPPGGDVTNGAVDITVRVRLTDDLSGVAGLGYSSSPSQAAFVSPSGAQTAVAMFQSHQDLVSGTALDGRYAFTMQLPRFSESGTWTLQYLLLADQVGNMRFLTHADVVAAGYTPLFALAGVSDTTPPTLQDLTFTPNPIDLTGGPAELVVRARITDDLSGVEQVGAMQAPSQIRLVSPSRSQSFDVVFSGYQLISGDALDGTYEQRVVLLGALETGIWSVNYFLLGDELGNLRSLSAGDLAAQGLPSTLVLQSNSDLTPPDVTEFSFVPAVVDATLGPAQIRFAGAFADGGAGLAAAGNFCLTQARFRSPSGGQFLDALFYGHTLVSGDLRYGQHEYLATVPHFAESGTWTMEYFSLFDDVCNRRDLTSADVAALGFPVSFVVVGADPRDTAAPIIAGVTPSLDSLWPRNHKWHTVTLDVVVTDAVDAAPVCAIVDITSNHGLRGYSFDGLIATLQAETHGNDVRIYTMTVACDDASGNRALAETHVSVKPSRRRD